MKFILTLANLVGVFCGTMLCLGAELTYPVFPLNGAPEMNSKWDEKTWMNIPVANGFTGIKTGEFIQKRQTAFKMGWHENNLYMMIRCEEPEPDKISPTSAGRKNQKKFSTSKLIFYKSSKVITS
ncbi:MAG: hypothetical protein PHS31_05395 [Victivallaceae bacterium]|nr:hypothetical protein [Victivallaceae bacterium]